MGAANVKKEKKTKNCDYLASNNVVRKPIMDNYEDPNPAFGSVGNVKNITYSFAALQRWSSSRNLLIPNEIYSKILLDMIELPKGKRSTGYITNVGTSGTFDCKIAVIGCSNGTI